MEPHDSHAQVSPEERLPRPGADLVRIGLLMAFTAAMLAWSLRHSEATFADGLRYIRQAQTIEQGDWRGGILGSIDHPVHPLGLVAAHAIVGGSDPISWQRAATALCFGCLVLLVVPLYLLSKELIGARFAWLGCLLVMANPLMGLLAVNVLSESTFLLFWTFGLWAALRFLREGDFRWLPVTIGFGCMAYLARPEGLLLPLAIVLSIAIMPLSHLTRIHWPRWAAAMAFLVVGSLLIVGPFMAVKGSIGTKPAIARVLGLEAASHPQALERERPLDPNQGTIQTHKIAFARMLRVIRGAVTPPLLILAVPGLLFLPRTPARGRTWLFLAILLGASAVGLVRLHATGGYCTVRHALVPGILLILASARGLTWMIERVSIPGAWLGMPRERLRPGPAILALTILVLVVGPLYQRPGEILPGPFNTYRDTGEWLARVTPETDHILDLTDWSLFFSQKSGYRFAHVYEAPVDPKLRWVIVRKPHREGHWAYSRVVRDLIGGREPSLLIPAEPKPGQLQVEIYDRLRERPELSLMTSPTAPARR